MARSRSISERDARQEAMRPIFQGQLASPLDDELDNPVGQISAVDDVIRAHRSTPPQTTRISWAGRSGAPR